MSAPHKRRLVPANDNERPHKPLRVVVDIPPDLPIQLVEIEVFAQLLDSLDLVAANDNEERQG
jgi:hypothetical protein